MIYENYSNLCLLSTEGSRRFTRRVANILEAWGACGNLVVPSKCARFGSGEGKGLIEESIRGKDIYVFSDVTNSSILYKMDGKMTRMSPDDHFADLKRLIGAMNGKARRVTVVMPFLYEGRQHRRGGRESLDCAMMLRELSLLGVNDIITFDAHDPRVQNAIPINSLENVRPTYQMLASLLSVEPELYDRENLMVVSPDEGAAERAIYIADILGLEVGIFYKRRDYTKIIDGRNPIIAHEFIGDSVEGKDVLVVDDMISSGDSMLDVAEQLKKQGAAKVFICATFGLFTAGMVKFHKAVKNGIVDRVVTTNLCYQKPELLECDYYVTADMEEYMAAIISSLHKDESISKLINPADKIRELFGI